MVPRAAPAQYQQHKDVTKQCICLNQQSPQYIILSVLSWICDQVDFKNDNNKRMPNLSRQEFAVSQAIPIHPSRDKRVR